MFILNKDLEMLRSIELYLSTINDDNVSRLCKSLHNFIAKYETKNKERARRQVKWNKEHREYHRITNNIWTARKTNNAEKLAYWQNELKKLKQKEGKLDE